MKIVIGADHGGFKLKEAVKKHLLEKNIETLDVGTFNEEAVDYPDIAKNIANKYAEIKADYMLAFCGTGIGISIAMNKLDGVYCAVVYNESSARLAKSHNASNAIAMGGRELDFEIATKMVDVFLETEVSYEQHKRRRSKIGY